MDSWKKLNEEINFEEIPAESEVIAEKDITLSASEMMLVERHASSVMEGEEAQPNEHLLPNSIVDYVTLNEWAEMVQMRVSGEVSMVTDDEAPYVKVNTYFGVIHFYAVDSQVTWSKETFVDTVRLLCEYHHLDEVELSQVNSLNADMHSGVLYLQNGSAFFQSDISLRGGVSVINVTDSLTSLCLNAEKAFQVLMSPHMN